jgi:hypothetical protein
MPSTRHLAIVVIVAALLALPAAAQARPGVIPPRWSAPSGPTHATPKPRPPAPPVDSALLGGGALILVALLGCAGRTVTARLA